MGISILTINPLALVVAFIIFAGALVYKNLKQKKDYEDKLAESKKNFDTMLSQKKSSEVRVGKIGENMAPFLKDWPYDPNRFRFLGNPVDGIQFTDDEIIFVEIKTGKSRLSKTQKKIKGIVRSGNVRFATFRVGENGCELKIEEKEGEQEIE